MCGKIRADADRRIIQNCPNGRGVCAPIHLFGSGLGHGLVRFVYLDPPGLISPLRTDSRQPVSKICWCVKTFGEMMNVPKRLEPTGFFSFAPACAGRFGWMRIGGSSKIARTAEGCVRRFTCLVPAWPAWGGSLVKAYEAPVRIKPPGYRRTFCEVCGGPLPTVDRGVIRIPAGTLDDDPGLRTGRFHPKRPLASARISTGPCSEADF